MTYNNSGSDHNNSKLDHSVPDSVAIEGDLPLSAIDIESQKDTKGPRAHPIRRFSKWFAARPTPAVRLAIIGSIYPEEKISNDELLKLMQIGPKTTETGIEDHVIKKYATKSQRSGNLDEHYGYPNPALQKITKQRLSEIQEDIRPHWGGDLPSVVDPTAGRGTIPFEAIRYGLTTISNELDPVPAVISKIALELTPSVGKVESEYNEYAEKIIRKTRKRTSEYFNTEEEGREIMSYAMTYLVLCDSCGGDIPLVSKWELRTRVGYSAVKPVYSNGDVNYEYIDENSNTDFDPSSGPLSGRGGDAECPHCDVTMDAARIREKFQKDSFEYSVYGVNYRAEDEEWEYRAGDEIDLRGIKKASERIESDFELMDFFAEPVTPGYNKNQIREYGLTEWRDLFTPRQLVVHYELFEVVDEIKEEIFDKYRDKKAKLLISLLAQAIDRQVQYNNRLTTWRSDHGSVAEIFSSQSYDIKRMFGDANIVNSRKGLERNFDHVIENHSDLANCISEDLGEAEIYSSDAARLNKYIDDNNIEVAIVDPPYFDSIMYGEMSDFMYLTQGDILSDVFPELMNKSNTNQMVANSVRHDNPRDFYESMVQSMFNQLKSILVENGIVTLMFTDREVKAWNTILKALIESNFTITAAHPIKTEASDKVGMDDAARVESSIFVTARNTPNTTESTDWQSVEREVKYIAAEEARRLMSIENVDKIDASIEAFGAALEAYSDAYPVEDKYGETVYPGQVLTVVRNEVYSIIANDELSTKTDQLDGISRWYILANVLYDDADIPFDEANQLGIGADIDISEIKRPTKIWSKSSGNVSLNNHTDRVQDIIKIRDSNVENPSTRKYPVNPTADSFTYTIDAVHAVLHVYEKEGQKATRDWLAQREFKSNQQFKKAIRALLEATPKDSQMRETLQDLVAGETGDYLDISVRELNIGDTSGDRQSGIEEYEQ